MSTECETVPWWQSRAIWSSIASVVAVVAAASGYSVDTTSLVEIALLVSAGIANGCAIWGRIHASTIISKKEVLPAVTLK